MIREVLQRLMQNRLAVFGLVLLGLFLFAALIAPIAAPHDPYFIRADLMLSAPSAECWLGADELGRDIFSRILYGARISFLVAGGAVGLALVAGTLLGMAAGYAGRRTDAVLSRFMDILFSVPDILLALAVMAVLGPKTVNVIIAIGIVYTPIFGRVVRGSVLELKEKPFVEAARALGIGPAGILTRHILPGLMAPLMVQLSLSLAFAVLAEAALSFLGLGVEPDTPSWGIMLNQGKDWLEQAWWIAVFPGIAITLVVFSFNVLGDGLRDALDPRLKQNRA